MPIALYLTPRPPRLLAVLLCSAIIGACTPDLGACDLPAAQELVYDVDGRPAFAGQALMIQSCGGGGFCHAATATPGERYGAPLGLELDLTLASSSIEVNPDASARFMRDHGQASGLVGDIWGQVSAGLMPPPGEVVQSTVLAATEERLRYRRYDAAGESAGMLPNIRSEEGRTIFRNWLSCGLPVVERTVARLDDEANVAGETAAACNTRCVDPTWEAIYAQVIVPGCAASPCHSTADLAGNLDLSEPPGGPGALVATLIATDAQGSQCEPTNAAYIVSGDADASLFYQKLVFSDSELCGRRMPLVGGTLGGQTLCALREWIDCGACVGADCDATCLAQARIDCGVVVESEVARCAIEANCANSL